VSAAAPAPRLDRIDFAGLAGLSDCDALDAFRCFAVSARAIAAARPEGRAARPPSAALTAAARAALAATVDGGAAARAFFEAWFRPHRVAAESGGAGFLTGYYEPLVPASPVETETFRWPLLARPADLGRRVPYSDRERIERERRDPIAWVVDAVEAFLIQVQGSAQFVFPDGRVARAAYDGRNGLPYTSVGRILIETGAIAERDMSLAALKAWLREAGVGEGQAGLRLMRRNRSFVFFRLVADFDPSLGPVAGAGVPLTPLRSIAVDRALWSYGLPFWIEAEIPWRSATPTAFRRLTIAQDTGSAIVGPARADLFFGGGDAAGARAGAIRHSGDFTVFLPAGDEP